MLNLVREVLSAPQDAETGERVFVITGAETFLEPYARAREILRSDLNRLQQLALGEGGKALISELQLTSRSS